MRDQRFYRKALSMLFTVVIFLILPFSIQAKELQTGMFGLWAYTPWDEGIRLVKDSGFSVVVIDGSKSRIETASRLGLKCIVDFKFSKATTQDPALWQKYLGDLRQKVTDLKDYPAIIAWYPVDEPDGTDIPLEYIKQVRTLIRSIDAKRPIFTVFNKPEKWSKYLPFFDILCIDPYLLKRNSAGLPDTTVKVKDWLKKIKSDSRKTKANKPIWITLQGFESVPKIAGNKDWWQEITPAVFNATLNIALQENVDGILVYTLASSGSSTYYDWNLPRLKPLLWDEVRKVPASVK
jgi:hypothetical protein